VLGFELLHRLRSDGVPDPIRLFVSSRQAPQLADPDPPIAGLPDDGFLGELRRRYDAIPAAVLAEPDLLAILLPPLRADYEVIEGYVFTQRPPLSCPISALGGVDDERVRADALDAWRVHTTGPFSRRLLPGGHFYLQGAEEHVAAVVAVDLAEHAPPGEAP
jgi:medium-chain acyl-[acyl-carrier-protein] hydrolase